MLGKQAPFGGLFQMVTLEELVPKDHFLRQLDAAVDFSFIRERVRHLYCENNGRPSIDPELALRMFILSYLYDISENRLCEEIQMHAGYRWFCRLNFHDEVPNRTTLVKLRRERWGPDGVFEDVMRHVVMECVKAGFVSTDVIAIDGTLVDARAAQSSLQPIKDPIPLEEYLKKIEDTDASEVIKSEDDEPPSEGDEPPSEGDSASSTFKGKKFSNETHRSRTDPDARLYSKGPRKGAELRYQAHITIDPKSYVILSAKATRCSGKAERETASEMSKGLIDQGFEIKYLLADGGYDGGEYLSKYIDLGIMPLIPAQGKFKPLPTRKKLSPDLEKFRALIKKRKAVAALNKTLLLRESAIYRRTYPLRIWVERLFGEAKECHGLRRARSYGLEQMNIQVHLTAIVQNLKRLVRWNRRRPKAPSAAASAVELKPTSTARAPISAPLLTISDAISRICPIVLPRLNPLSTT